MLQTKTRTVYIVKFHVWMSLLLARHFLQEERVKTGYVTCECHVNNKKISIVKKKPQIPNNKLYITAGLGAGGMTGVMGLVTVLYIIIKKVTKSPAMKNDIHPHQNVKY